MIQTKIIITKFVRNKRKLPFVISIFKKLIPIPVTHSGGINAVAIATPATPSQSFLNHKERNAIIPHTNAINRLIIVGDILANISGVRVATGVIFVMIHAIAIVTSMVSALIFNHLLYKLPFPVDVANAIILIGLRIGAINIAPIITGTELINSHKLQIITERINCNRYSLPKLLSSIISDATSVFLSLSSKINAIL